MSEHVLRGGCHCGRLACEVRLSQPVSAYTPRACDCAFCRKHGAAWLSDAQGALHLRRRGEVLRYRQGSGQAKFIACPHCAVLVMVTCEIDGRLHAALNVRALEGEPAFAPEQPASPRRLEAQAKRERWEQVWCADVRISDIDD